jgi:mannose-6-phosphate isomerase-like protein (cupin superfamily)
MRPPILLLPLALLACSASTPAPAPTPVDARFLDATATPASIPVGPCHQLLLAAVQGSVVAAGQPLSPGDVLAVTDGPVSLSGSGLAVAATVAVTPCAVPRHVVLASAAPDLAFFGGAMHAHLDLDDRAVAPSVYLGRLAGPAAVPEHAHDTSWEILCALKAAGTFTLAARPQRLGDRTCIAVPPGVKHSWQPDPGGPSLVAVQLYAPPGPEQRFKKLAAEGANGANGAK